MGLTPKGMATKQRIVAGAADYMRGDDPGAVRLDDIRAITGTSKSQLFHYFPGGKADLLLAVARHEAERVLDDQQPHLGMLDSWSAWQRWRDSVVTRYRSQGRHCPLGVLIGQIDGTPGAGEVIAVLMARWQQHLRRGIAGMQASGNIRGGLDADRTAAAFIAVIQGGVQVLRATGDSGHLEAGLDTLIEYLHG